MMTTKRKVREKDKNLSFSIQPKPTVNRKLIMNTVLLAAMVGAASAVSCGQHACVQPYQTVCEGDTRGDRRCNHDATHRVW
jgi:hypothetical protein